MPLTSSDATPATLPPADFAARLREALSALADPQRAPAMAAYMKGHFAFFGVPMPARRAAVKPLVVALGRRPDPDWLLAVAEALWACEERECQYVAADLLVKFARLLEARHEPRLARLVQTRAWWDTVDPLASRVYGTLVRSAPALCERLDAYASHPDLWLRRVAILHQLSCADDTDRARLDAILTANLAHTDFFIRKAMGWALREFAYTDPDWVRAWLGAHADEVSGLTRREALKRIG
ncbi:DNA alkylation repair protein [Uliginosibacterium paludis]|uniref:DNA alkylation repair protein n=1 Tax=Uliginosibacterium paludis TaxID=1615952 RepID=A0ABV2CSF6_9RHOO